LKKISVSLLENAMLLAYIINKLYLLPIDWLVGLMVFNTTFNNISVISWQSVLLVEETGGHGENH
jgi:prepilin signal peptidase PulO-like enzyme (type II secretory pathway)